MTVPQTDAHPEPRPFAVAGGRSGVGETGPGLRPKRHRPPDAPTVALTHYLLVVALLRDVRKEVPPGWALIYDPFARRFIALRGRDITITAQDLDLLRARVTGVHAALPYGVRVP